MIVTSGGGAGEVVEDGVNGFVRDPTDVEAWKRAALEILRDPARRARLQVAAREAARERFCRDRRIEEYEEEYEAAIHAAALDATAR